MTCHFSVIVFIVRNLTVFQMLHLYKKTGAFWANIIKLKNVSFFLKFMEIKFWGLYNSNWSSLISPYLVELAHSMSFELSHLNIIQNFILKLWIEDNSWADFYVHDWNRFGTVRAIHHVFVIFGLFIFHYKILTKDSILGHISCHW